MMGKDQIRSPTVNIVGRAEMGQRYRGVFDVPTRSPFSPRAVPENLSQFLTLPNDKIARVSLVRVRVNAVDRQLFEVLSRELSVFRKLRRVVIDAAWNLVADSLVNERPDLVYDLGDIVGRFGVEVYALDAEVLHVLVECLCVPRGEPERVFAGLSRSVDDPIIDVGDVEDKEDAVSYSPEITRDNVIVNVGLRVADMAGVIDCGSTYEHVDSSRMDGPELVRASGQGIVDSQAGLGGSCHVYSPGVVLLISHNWLGKMSFRGRT